MLTRLRVGQLPDPSPTLAQAAWAFPLVGLVTGTIGWIALHLALTFGLSTSLASLVALAALTLTTGALHEDGLADFADGLGGGRDRDHCLEIMRDSRIGSYGAVALVFLFGFKAVALSEIAVGPILVAFLFLGTASRLMMLACLVWMPAAREDGLGHAAAGPSAMALVPGFVALALAAIYLGPPAFAAFATMAFMAAMTSLFAYRRIGGQTGDVLGAVQSLSEAAGFVALAALIG